MKLGGFILGGLVLTREALLSFVAPFSMAGRRLPPWEHGAREAFTRPCYRNVSDTPRIDYIHGGGTENFVNRSTKEVH